jgi:hypothetical protein
MKSVKMLRLPQLLFPLLELVALQAQVVKKDI